MVSTSRLYESFLPKEYSLALNISSSTRSFDGTVRIMGHKPHGTQPITLHSKDLIIHSVHVNGVMSPATTGPQDTLCITNAHVAGDYEIVISYSGKITDTMHGLYPGRYRHEGIDHEILATQFESHHAREVFPCVDEPEAKATFSLEITTKPGVHVLSNMPLQKTTRRSNHVTHHFPPTPRMSSYLVAFVIGEFNQVSGKTKNGTKVAIHATRAHHKNSMTFALDIAIRAIEFLENYFGVPYPLEKSDHIALPDFSAGAMENWGLITYREKALLAEPSAPQATKELIATVICHELSHQWFGNLVTMKWWDDLWLNESFANLMEYIVIDALHPEWGIWQEFAAVEVSTALNRDYIGGVQPVHSIVRHPDEISVLFDPAIVYAKGSRLLKMLRTHIGEKAFRLGLTHYFTTHAYGNTTSADLWRSFNHFTDIDVESLMSPWLKQSGFPVVSVRTTKDGYTVSQKRLVIGGHDDQHKWEIPLFPRQNDFPSLLTSPKRAFQARHEFPQLNMDGNSHFVTTYDDDANSLMLAHLQKGAIDATNRLLFLFEQLLLAKSGALPFTRIITLLDYYTAEREQAVWSVIAHSLRELRRFAESLDDIKLWSLFVQQIVLSTATELGSKEHRNETEGYKKMRGIVYTLLLEAGHKDTVQTFIDIAKNYDFSKSHTLRPAVLRALAQYGGQEDFARLMKLHRTTTDPHLRQDLADALASTTDEDHVAILMYSLSDSAIIKPQDITRWYVSLSNNPSASQQAWSWMRHSWSYLSEMFDGDKSYDAFPRYTARAMNTHNEYREYCSFFEPKQNNPALRRAITIGKTEVKHRSKLIANQRGAVIQMLKDMTR